MRAGRAGPGPYISMTLQLRAYLRSVVRRGRRLPWGHGARLPRQAAWILQLAWQTALALGGVVLAGLLLAWLTLQWAILPHIENWRPMMERHASAAIGVPVKIGRITVNSSGWIPALELRDVVLSDRNGGEALRLPRVAAAITPRSVLTLHPRFAQLYVEGARLLVRRDAHGGLHVGGLDMAASASLDDGRARDWFFRQQEVVVRHGALRWVDEARAAPPLELSDVDIVVRNGLRSHDLRVDATPPADWGDRVALRGRFTQPLFAGPGNWRRWSGTMYLDLPRGDVALLRHHVDLPFAVEGGRGALRAWVDVQDAAWRAAVLDVRLEDVDLRLGPDLQPLAIAHAQGRLTARRDAQSVSLGAEHLAFATADGVDWPAGDLHVSWRARDALATPAPWQAAGAITGGQLSADRLDLTLMARLAGALPLPAPARRWLDDLRPEGVVRHLAARWDGPLDAPRHYDASATLEHLSLAPGAAPLPATPGRPGLRNATMQLQASESGGRASVSLDGGAVALPGIFEQPLVAFDKLGGTVDWHLQQGRDAAAPSRLAVDIRALHFANADAEGDLQLHWHTGDGARVTIVGAAGSAATPAALHGARFPGLIDLRGTLQRGKASSVARYLPMALSPATRTYLRQALHGGALSAVRFGVQGDLADFPFRHREGEFRIAGHVQDLGLDYVPAERPADAPDAPVASAWPPFREVQGDILIEHGALEIRNARARVRDVELRDVQGGIRGLYDDAVLSLKGRTQGPLQDYLRYVDESPVGGWLSGALKSATGSGNADLDLALAIPLRDASRTTLQGALVLPGNDVKLMAGLPPFGNARARIAITQAGVTVTSAQARLLGGDASFDGGTQPDGSLRFTGQGVATADGLRRGLEDPALARAAAHLSGQAGYRIQVGVRHGLPEVVLTSSLAGMGIALPAPLNKPAAESWPLRVQSSLQSSLQTSLQPDPAGRGAALPRDTWHVELGTVAQAEVQREIAPAGTRVLRAAYAVGAALPAPQPGGVAQIRLGAVNGDAWWALAKGWEAGAASPAAAPGAGAAPADAGAGAGVGTSSAISSAGTDGVPRSISLKAQDLLLGGKHLTNVSLQVAPTSSPDGERWRAAIESDQTHGVVDYRPAAGARSAHLFARLDRLSLAEGDAGNPPAPDAATPGANAPTASVPALDIVVDSFEIGAKRLGKLEVAATQADAARDWRLNRLAVTSPEATFVGSGVWSGGTVRRVALDFRLALNDSGALLERLGFGRVVKGGKGELTGSVAWTGSPLAIDYPTLGGQLQLAVDQGQFLKADAGAGRLLGLLSLQSLPRRLTLDFRDLFQEGFAFDNVGGDVTIERGVARTNNLRIRSVSAAILMEGHTNLHDETQDLHVVVVPEINAGTASLAYAVINPVIGLGTFLAQMFLRKPLMQAGTRELHVTGTWSDPKVETLSGHAVEAAALAASAPASPVSSPVSSPASAPASAALARPASGTMAP